MARVAVLLLATIFVVARAAGAQPASGTTPSGLSYETSGTGTPLVFIHAFSVDRRMWDGQLSTFAGRYRVIRGSPLTSTFPYARRIASVNAEW